MERVLQTPGKWLLLCPIYFCISSQRKGMLPLFVVYFLITRNKCVWRLPCKVKSVFMKVDDLSRLFYKLDL